MDVTPRPWRIAVGARLFVLVFFIACDKSYQFENPMPVDSRLSLYMNQPFKYPYNVGYKVAECKFELTCRNRCNQVRDSSYLFCHCDQLCRFYGDCCFDYYSECLGVGIADQDAVIIRAVLAELRSYYDFLSFYAGLKWALLSSCQKINEQYIQVVRACSSDPGVRFKFESLRGKITKEAAFVGISSADIVYECETRLTDDDHLTLPVSLTKDHVVHFYNVFCAICNGIDPRETLAWNLSIRYKNVTWDLHNPKHSTIKEILTSTTLDRRWCIQYGNDHVEKANEDNEAKGGQSTDASSEAKANSTYGLCKPAGSVSAEVDLCRRFLRPYLIKPNDDMLKNQYCTLCNGDKVVNSCSTNKCVCPESYYVFINYVNTFSDDEAHGSGASENLPNLKDIFYFRDQSMTKWVNETSISIETKSCPENKVFSRFYGQCVDVVCPDGTISSTLGRCPDQTSTCNGGREPCEGDAGINSAESATYPLGSNIVSLVFRIKRVTDLDAVALDRDNYGADIGQIEHGDTSLTKTNTKANMVIKDALEGMPETSTSFTTKSNSKGDMEKAETADEGKSKVNSEELGAFSEFPMSLQSMRSVWISQIFNMETWNFTNTFTEILRSMQMFPDYKILMKDVQFSIKTTEYCPVAGTDVGHGNASSPDCQQYIDVRFSYNDSRTSSAILSLVEKEIVSQMIDSAHKNDHVLVDVRLTNTDVQKTAFLTDGLCGSGRRAENISLNVTADGNGTYTAHVDGFSAHPIDHFKFSLAVIVDETTGDIRLDEKAEVVVCVANVSMSNCSMVFYASADIVEYEDHLVITRHAEELLRFLSDSAALRGASLTERLKKFSDSNNASSLEVHPRGAYLMSDSGAYVCSDYSRNYSLRNETVVQVLRRFRTMSDSVPEQIATVLALAVSIACLVAVLVVYGLVPELRNTPGKIVMSMSGTLLLAQVMLLCSAYPKGLACGIYATVQHAAWLASSAWLTAMAAHLRHVLYSQSKSREKSIFGPLAFLCWGLPSLLAASCFTLDRIGILDLEYDSGKTCWLNNTFLTIFAFGMPLLLLVATTFICGVFIVRAIQKSSEFVNKATKDRQRARGQLLICINIASLMGMDWAIYFIAMLADTEAVWVLFILANGLQGLFVFLCYAAKRSVMKKLVKRWRHRPADSSNFTSNFTSSNGGSTWTTSRK